MVCEKCNFICGKKIDWERHILTYKHSVNYSSTVEHKIRQTEFVCKKCTKTYNARNSLWYHEKKCNYSKDEPHTEHATVEQHGTPDFYAIINLLIKENQEQLNFMVTQHNTIVDQNNNLAEKTNSIVEQNKALTEQNKTLTELVKNQQPTTNTNNSYNNNNNQNYNINMFLSDKCKDAQNLSEFIEVLKTKVDMMKIGQDGYVNGISKLFIDELNAMEVTERPLHCTDERRNTFYVHNDDAWKKDENLKDTKNAIFHVSQVNVKQCVDWSKITPEDEDDRNDHVTRSIHLYQEAVKSSDDKHVDKIIKNISKEIPLNKQVICDVVV